MAESNQDAVRLVKPFVESAAASAVAVYIGKGGTLPTAAGFIGQMFVLTGDTNPGLYVATGTTTPGWKAVSHAE